eukprot:CAMPEP_0116898754 /NCGR_PEP_ID=MMETSP0467-20121206/7434_1 /TAXON_ID=283647 /ORGANISM="Mesodinium pulex, Strain SPMC105" /LENGTH=122 /DNA_ID=CAMNT_0004571113 /DNA_START=580 /DNA_END=948 /DNA_ORIENTATION=-
MMSKEHLKDEVTFKKIINHKFDEKIEKIAHKYNIKLNETPINMEREVEKMQHNYVDPSSVRDDDYLRWVNRFCKNNGVKMNIQMIKEEKKRTKVKQMAESDLPSIENDIHFIDCNNHIAKMS